MKMQLLLISIMGMLLMTSNVYAESEKSRPYSITINSNDRGENEDNHSVGNSGGGSSYNNAPEINAASGGSAIALLTGVLLLAGERARSKRTLDKPKTEEA